MTDTLDSVWHMSILHNSLQAWAMAIVTTVVAVAVLYLAKRILVSRFSHITLRTATMLDDFFAAVFKETHVLFLVAIGLIMGASFLKFGDKTPILQKFFTTMGWIQIGLWSVAAWMTFLHQWQARKAKDASVLTLINVLDYVGKLGVWSLVFLLVLDNWGVQIKALLAGVGIGGIAIALGLQGAVQDVFASISIVTNKMFEVGDFIRVEENMGTVERIGIKNSQIRSLSGEEIIFPNSKILANEIRNFNRMPERRVIFSLRLLYDTPYEKLRAIPGMIRAIIESQSQIRFDRAHFSEYGEFALIFEVVYFVLSRDYNLYMDIHQQVNLRIYKKFEEENIHFAYVRLIRIDPFVQKV